jgi:hypothetical protein
MRAACNDIGPASKPLGPEAGGIIGLASRIVIILGQ